jgi:hypothetical protein
MAKLPSPKKMADGAFDATKMVYDPAGVFADNSLSQKIWGKKDKGPNDPQAQLDAILAEMAKNNENAISQGQSIYDRGYQGANYSGDFNPGELDPNSLSQLDRSALEGISVDPRYRAAELQALEAAQQRVNTGLTAEDEAALAAIARDTARTNRGNQAAIQSNFAQRGIGGAGMEFAARQQAAQDAAEQEAIRGLEVAAMAQRNKQAAINDSAQIAGQLGNTDYSRAAQAAQAQDIINRFNAQNRVDVQRQNYANQVAAQQSNLNRRDNMSQFNSSGLNNFNQNQVDFGMDAASLRNQGAARQYDSVTDAYNRAAMRAQERNAAIAARKGAVHGMAGTIVGGYFGGPAGAQAGNQAGQSVAKINS